MSATLVHYPCIKLGRHFAHTQRSSPLNLAVNNGLSSSEALQNLQFLHSVQLHWPMKNNLL